MRAMLSGLCKAPFVVAEYDDETETRQLTYRLAANAAVTLRTPSAEPSRMSL